MRILVTGASGLLGTDVVRLAAARGHQVIPLARSDLDVTDLGRVRQLIGSNRPDTVVHCAAYTAVDKAEEEPGMAVAVNRDGTRNVAVVAAEIGAHVCYVSTDYVFDGGKGTPYAPDDLPAPLSVYGMSKLAGEEAVRRQSPDSLIVRAGWLFGDARPTFVTALLERAERGESITVVKDQIGRPSWSAHVADALLDLVELRESGAWHVANGGTASRYELALEALRLSGIDAQITGVASDSWSAAAKRPLYSVLDISATEERIGRRMWPWGDALSRFLSERANEEPTD